MLPNSFALSLSDALGRLSGLTDHSLDYAVGTPEPGRAPAGEVIAGIRTLWNALRRVLRPSGMSLLVCDSQPENRSGIPPELAWRIAFSLQKERWILRNAVIGPVRPGGPSTGIGFIFVPRIRYSFDIDAVRAQYGTNPGDVVLPDTGCIADRFAVAACSRGGRLTDLFTTGSQKTAVVR